MAAVSTEPAAAPARAPAAIASSPSGGRSRWRAPWVASVLVAGVLCFVTFIAKGGLSLESMTTVEMALTVGAGLLIAAAVIALPQGRRPSGLWSVALLLAFAALTVLSVVWSVQPAASWQDASRMLAYSYVFAAAVVLVALVPGRWPALLGGITLAAVVVCAYALLTKIFPASLDPSNTFARLEEPYGYWNAIGLTAAMGAIGCLWLGARRTGHALVSAMSYPAMGVLLLTLALAYSRGALAALAVGLLAWFCLVPLRLRSAALLILGALAAGGVAGWAFSVHALSADRVALAERTTAGHRLGALVLAMVLLLAGAGIAIGFFTGRRAPSLRMRRRAGGLLLATIVLALVAFAGALAHSHRGFTGSISHAVDSLTNPNAKTPPNTPDRLTAVASVRARYWKEALQVFQAHPVLGVGAMGYQTARLRYRKAPLVVAHAHGFVVQTMADLGIVGLALALALLACWMAAAGRATHPFDRRWAPWAAWRNVRSPRAPKPGWHRSPQRYTPERVGLLTMLCIVVAFGAHSFVDWTWYVPGDACVALICAGWLAGRGELGRSSTAQLAADGSLPASSVGRQNGRASGLRGGERLRRALRQAGPVRTAIAVAALAGALLAAWSQWQPLRSEDARQRALELLAGHPREALAQAEEAVSRDPLSAEALFTLAEVQRATGHPAAARASLQRAVREQPSNPQTWLALGRYDLTPYPAAALTELQAAIYLDPESIAPEVLARGDREAIAIYNDYVQALRSSQAASAAARSANARRARAAAAARAAARRRTARARARSRNHRAAR